MNIRPAMSALGSWMDVLRVRSPELTAQVARIQKPVPKIQGLWGHADGFETAPGRLSTRSATPMPKQGASNATNLHRDSFEVAARKPVELAPKSAPAVRSAPWLKENSAALPKPDFVASFNDL